MKVRFDQIGKKAHCVLLDGKSLSLEDGKEDISLEGRVILYRKRSADSVVVRGEVAGQVVGECAFCAADALHLFQEEFTYQLIVGLDPLLDELGIECQEEDVEKLYLQEPEVDLDEILREQIYLNLPLQFTCSSSCKGICPDCGGNRNFKKCDCADAVVSSSPFAVLSKLKK